MKSFFMMILLALAELIAIAIMSYPFMRKINNKHTSVALRNILGVAWLIALGIIITAGQYIFNPTDF